MATIRINYYKPPQFKVGTSVLDITGEFISSEKLTVSGSSVSTSSDIPEGTGIIKVHGDSDFVIQIAETPTAVDDSTCESHPATIPLFKEFNPLSLNNYKIAVLDV